MKKFIFFICAFVFILSSIFSCAPDTPSNRTIQNTAPDGSNVSAADTAAGLELASSVSLTSAVSSFPFYISMAKTPAGATASSFTKQKIPSNFTNPVVISSPLGESVPSQVVNASLNLYSVLQGSFSFALTPFKSNGSDPNSETFYYLVTSQGSFQMTDRNSCKVRMYAGKMKVNSVVSQLTSSNIETALGSLPNDQTQVYYSIESATSNSNRYTALAASLVALPNSLQPLPSSLSVNFDNFGFALPAITLHYIFLRSSCSTFYIPISSTQEIAFSSQRTSFSQNSPLSLSIPNANKSAGFFANKLSFKVSNSVLRYISSSTSTSLLLQTTSTIPSAETVNLLYVSNPTAIPAQSSSSSTSVATASQTNTATQSSVASSTSTKTASASSTSTTTGSSSSTNTGSSTSNTGNSTSTALASAIYFSSEPIQFESSTSRLMISGGNPYQNWKFNVSSNGVVLRLYDNTSAQYSSSAPAYACFSINTSSSNPNVSYPTFYLLTNQSSTVTCPVFQILQHPTQTASYEIHVGQNSATCMSTEYYPAAVPCGTSATAWTFTPTTP